MPTTLNQRQLNGLLYGSAPTDLSCLAFKILLARLRFKASRDESAETKMELIDALQTFLEKNEQLVAKDIQALFQARELVA